jgi:hypothetical protein
VGEVSLRIGGATVAEYQVVPDVDPTNGPRPYLHPVRTLGGALVTDALPEDHLWHLGVSLAVQDVNANNLWGGRTYVRDIGYTWLPDHGRIEHLSWVERADDRLAHRLRWVGNDGGTLLTEERLIEARPVPGRDDAWVLDFRYTLTAPAERDITLGSPATNGRPGGAGYGGFFWRIAAHRPDADPPLVFTAGAEGEEAANGSTEPWLAMAGTDPAGTPYTLVFTGLAKGDGHADGDHWFVRSTMYPGVCAAFAFDRPRAIAAGSSRTGEHAVVVADGTLTRAEAADLAALAVI